MSDYSAAYEYVERQAARQPFCADEAAHVFAYHNDALTFLRTLPDASVHAVITDPPYGFADHKPERVVEALTAWANGDRDRVPTGRGFMGREWDAFVPPPALWDECLRVLKPGGHLAVFAGSRTVDLMGLSIRLAGFEMRDGIAAWLYGSGFPKSMDVGKALDKAAGVEREVVGVHRRHGGGSASSGSMSPDLGTARSGDLGTAPATDAAREWDGWGTALKPAHEPILLARKPLSGTVAANVLAHGAGGINIAATRVESGPRPHIQNAGGAKLDACYGSGKNGSVSLGTTTEGRWPTNVVLAHHPSCGPDGALGPCVDGCQVAALDAQSEGTRAAKPSVRIEKPAEATPNAKTWEGGPLNGARPVRGFTDDQGGASRFFPTFRYQAKAPKAERPIVDGTGHPTVKPLGLMRWLVRLLVPEGGTVLDPFAGSGATLEAARLEGVCATGVERDEHSCKLIAERLGMTALEPIVGAADPADELLSRVNDAGSVDELMELYRQAVAEQLWCDEIKTVFTARKMAVAS